MRPGAGAEPSARAARGELTLMGVGPAIPDGVPRWGMYRTPSEPIVLEPRTARADGVAATVQIPIPDGPALAATLQIPIEETVPVQGPPRRIDSLYSAPFFQEGDYQEANGWQTSPLAREPSPDELELPFSSFDHIARRRGPLVATLLVGSAALLIFFGAQVMKTTAAHAWLATQTGQRVAEVWNKARMGLAAPPAAGDVAASARAMTEPQRVSAAVPVPEAPVTAAAVVVPPTAPRTPEPAAPTTVAPPRVAVAAPATVATRRGAAAAPVTTAASEAGDEAAPAVETPPPAAPVVKRHAAEPAQRGLVWSPAEQRLIPARAASAEQPAANTGIPATTDKDVLPLDDDDHETATTP